MMRRNGWLIAGGVLSAMAAGLHLAAIFGGPAWYRFFGAGEKIARMAERGSPEPALITLVIVGILAVWAAYAFSGAGLIRRLPLLRTILIAISTVYLLRGLILVPFLLFRPDLVSGLSRIKLALSPSDAFMIWSSLIVLVYGVAYAAGTWTAWPQLSPKAR